MLCIFSVFSPKQVNSSAKIFHDEIIIIVWTNVKNYRIFFRHRYFKLHLHCMKNVKYTVISGPYFPVFGLNTEIYGVNIRIQSKYRKIRTINNNFVFGPFSRSAAMCRTSIFPDKWQWALTLQYFYLWNIYYWIFLYKYNRFLHFHMILAALLIIPFSSF